MKNIFTKVFVAVAIVASVLVPASAQAAGTAAFSLSPSSASFTTGNSFSLQVFENGTNVNVVTAKLTYDASKLTCNGVGGSSAFPNTIAASCGGGSVTISRYTGMDGSGNPTTVSGTQSVGSISFTAINTGTAVVNFASGSQIASGGSNIWNGNTAGGTYTISAPVVSNPTPSNPTNSSGNTSSNTSQSSSSTSKTTPGAKTTTNSNQNTPGTDQSKDVASNTSGQTPTTKSTTDKATTSDTKKVAGYNPTLVIVLAIIAVLAGAGAIYANRNPKKVAAIAAAVLAVMSKKKPAAKPVAKKTLAKKANVTSKTTKATKSKKNSAKKSTKKA